MTLSDLPRGTVAVVREIASPDPAFTRRMFSLGLFPGQRIEILHRAPLGDPLQVRAGQTLLSLRKQDAGSIELMPEAPCA